MSRISINEKIVGVGTSDDLTCEGTLRIQSCLEAHTIAPLGTTSAVFVVASIPAALMSVTDLTFDATNATFAQTKNMLGRVIQELQRKRTVLGTSNT